MLLNVTRDQSARRQVLKDRLAALRYDYEVGGMIFNGVRVSTDRNLGGMIGARLQEPGGFPFDFKTADGHFFEVDMPTLILIRQAFITHTQGAFAAERRVADQIDADTITDLAGVESAWTDEITV